jgi:Ca2+-binding RTX toxin-like protein
MSGPALAGAAVTVGQTAPGEGDVLLVGGPTLCVQDAVAGPPGYTIPAGGGVITSWSVQARAVAGDQAQLKVVNRASSTSFTVVGQDTNRTLASGVLNEFSTRIAVSGGEILAMWVPGVDGPCMFSSDNEGDLMRYRAEPAPEEPGIGNTFATPDFLEARRVNIAVRLEPDADGDGFGDETQDQCLGQAGPNNGCLPAPSPAPQGVPSPEPPPCNGKPASIVGTGGADQLTGTPAADVIAALGGNDKVSGLAGSDVICGGTGKDKLKGGPGKDTLVGQKGKDTLNGGGSKDTCIGGTSNDSASNCEVEKSV